MIDLHQILQAKLELLDAQLSDAKHTRRLLQLEKDLTNLPPFKNLASVNSLVTLRTPLGTKNFFLVPEGLGGQTVNDVFLLSVESPLAKSFLNQKVGYTFSFNGGNYQIVFTNPNL